jgi:hypothetical protein
MSTELERAYTWITGRDTGLSSKTIWAFMVGSPLHHDWDDRVPLDPDDFGRCYRLLSLIPEWRPRLSDMAEAKPEWRPLVREWSKLTRQYVLAINSQAKVAPSMYNLMRQLREEGEACKGRPRER